MSKGKILAYSGLMEGKEVSWMPSYGPEQRGGTANVTVILSDERISSPVLNEYDIAIILNQPSMDKFESKGGFMDGKVVSMETVNALASIPALPVLQAQVLGTMLAPISALACVLKQIAEKDGAAAE